jgi:hypothetical protein
MISVALLALAVAPARGDDAIRPTDEGTPATHHVEPPPAPEEHEPTPAVSMNVAAVAPIERSTICPVGHDCVIGVGVGVGVQVEWRSADRVGLVAGYDFWLLDGNGVYELGALHASRVGLRYVVDDATRVHPFIDAAVGLLAFGDAANVATLGGLVTAGAGAEIELTESVAFVAALESWFFATGSFVTPDGAWRSSGFGVNAALQITVGIAIQVGPMVAAP